MTLTAEILRELVSYDPDTGDFKWKISGGRRKCGQKAGSNGHPHGYCQIGIDCTLYFAHRLAWLYVHGEWPRGEVDHIDGDTANNRIANLRDTSHAANMQNIRKANVNNSTGFLGTRRYKSGKFFAVITANGKRRFLGSFVTPQSAHEAYLTAKRMLHMGCTI